MAARRNLPVGRGTASPRPLENQLKYLLLTEVRTRDFYAPQNGVDELCVLVCRLKIVIKVNVDKIGYKLNL